MSKDRILADFGRTALLLPGAGVPWLDRARHAGLERFAQSGYPTQREEEWKYTGVAAIEKRAFMPLPNGAAAALNPSVFDSFAGHRAVFVNGRHAPALSSPGRIPGGITLESLATALEHAPEALEPLFSDERGQTVFGALNTAFAADGLYLRLPRGAALDEPVHVFFVATAENAAIFPRNVIVAEDGARVTVVEHYAGTHGVAYFTNALTQIFAAENAAVEHYKLQQEAPGAFHIAGIHTTQRRGSRLESHSISLGAALARNDITTTLDAESCEATLNGLYLAHGRQHVDHHTRIDHAKPDGTSREYYRGLLEGASRGVFNGKVIVQPQAQRSDALQLNHNLLLSKDAEIDTKPQLEIYADDVKCTHGATVGQLDDAQLFYLRSRGMDEAMARSLLVFAFARDAIERIGEAPLRNRVEELLLARLPQGERVRALA